MDFEHSDKIKDLIKRLEAFMDEHIYPNQELVEQQIAAMGDEWTPVPVIEALKPIAQEAGLWNLFLPESELGAGLTRIIRRGRRRNHQTSLGGHQADVLETGFGNRIERDPIVIPSPGPSETPDPPSPRSRLIGAENRDRPG